MGHRRVRSALRSQTGLDAALAAGLTVAGLAEIWIPSSSPTGSGSPIASTVLVVLLGVALALRRIWPVAVLAAVVSTSTLAYWFGPVYVQFWGGMVPIMVALYTVARHRTAKVAWSAAALTAVLLLSIDVVRQDLDFDTNDIAFRWVNAAIALAIGRVLRHTEESARASALRARAAEEEAELAGAAARREERARIAREMHDVVAHSVSVMVVQAGAAESALEEDPDYSRAALGRIRDLGAEALEDMRRVLEVLRDPAEVTIPSPQPGLALLPDLLDQAEAGGLRTRLAIEGEPRPLPAGLDLTAYRIVQEALTNVRRHADADLATISIRFGLGEVEVEVRDDGTGPAAPAHPVAGHGIAGMRERAALFGGRLEAGAAPGGFRVWALLPLESR